MSESPSEVDAPLEEGIGETPPLKPPPRRERARAYIKANWVPLSILLALIMCYIGIFLYLSLARYSNFKGSEFDTAIFNQVIWLLSRGKGAYSTIRGMNLFGDHFAPMLFLLAPLRGNVAALLTLQTIVLGAGAVPVYFIAKDELDSRWLPVGLAAAYLLYPALQYVNLFDFHPESIGLVALLFAFLAVIRKRFVWFYVMCGLAAICKEDMVLAVLVLGIIVYFLYDKRAGKWVFWSSAAYFAAIVAIIIPRLAPAGYQYSGRLTRFGKTTKEAVKNFFLHPRNTYHIVVNRVNMTYVFELTLPVAFLCFFAPLLLLPALPAFFINVISDFEGQHTITYQYTAALIPFVFIALIFGLRKFRRWVEGARRERYIMAGVLAIVLACTVASSFLFGPRPFAMSAGYTPRAYAADNHSRALDEGLSRVPAGASVSASTFMLAKLSGRVKVYQFPEPFRWLVGPEFYKSMAPSILKADPASLTRKETLQIEKIVFPNTYRMKDGGKSIAPEYVVLDTGTELGMPEATWKALAGRVLASGYKPVFERDGVTILKRQ